MATVIDTLITQIVFKCDAEALDRFKQGLEDFDQRFQAVRSGRNA